MFILNTFEKVGGKTCINIDEKILSQMPCGVFRASLEEANNILPELFELFESFPVSNPEEYEFDVKIHMLMPEQYPCVPNWHCDNVKRDENKMLDYASTTATANQPMYLWVSNGPHTEFLKNKVFMEETPKNHGDVAKFMNSLKEKSGDLAVTEFIPAQQWVKFDTTSPHRGTKSDRHQWRIFVRATHNSIVPIRPKISAVRRHCQVYLDSNNFDW